MKYLLSLSNNREKIFDDFFSADRSSNRVLKSDTKVLFIPVEPD